jgi:hypothetical protein
MVETLQCPHCQTAMTYCPGCGLELNGRYRQDIKQCINCGATLSHCGICGGLLVPTGSIPITRGKKAYHRYCPACGDPIGEVTDHCPHCGIDIELYMDHIYESTYDRVNQIVLEEEANQPLETSYPKKKSSVPGNNKVNQISGFNHVIPRLLMYLARFFEDTRER